MLWIYQQSLTAVGHLYCLPGSHGAGHPSETLTPLVAWGAGVHHPRENLLPNTASAGMSSSNEEIKLSHFSILY